MKISILRFTLNAAMVLLLAQQTAAQTEPPPPVVSPGGALSLPLGAARRAEIERALKEQDYRTAETILVEEINRNPGSAPLLAFAAGIFFLDDQYLSAAVAYKKAERIAPLDERSRFTLAMAYIKLGRRDWARSELEKLTSAAANNPLYRYWLARLDYDASQYAAAVGKLQQVIKLDPAFMKAYDNLGLCYEALGENGAAIRSYEEAIRLNRGRPPHSPWPSLNLGVLLIKLGRLEEAESYLRESLRYDPKFAQGHYQLGALLEKQNRYAEAIQHLNEATTHTPTYAEPYYVLGRIYRRSGDRENAEKALSTFQRLKKEKRQN